MERDHASDTAVTTQKEDRFQRYGFAKRIAQTIVQRKSPNSLVLGLFGAWGEGKTSVLNFVRKEITEQSDEIIQITFNPWRFGSEEVLLIMFFNSLAKGLEKSLKNKKHQIGKAFKKYSSVLSAIPIASRFTGMAEKVGEELSKIDLDAQKAKIEKILREEKRQIVITIDDIDRLDKDEIYALLRLVKLTANFPYTTYLLACDDKMVAAAIGERFGTGDMQSGKNFLEKIVQVPLRLPKARPIALKNYCLQFLDEVLTKNQVELSSSEKIRLTTQFTTNLLSRLKTPRLIIRYVSTIEFLVPLLKGEVNIVDLLLIEAVKVFYPRFYQYITDNYQYFTVGYFYRPISHAKFSEVSQDLDSIESNLTKKEISKIKSLLKNLFPQFNILDNEIADFYKISWYNDKRLCSETYFDRYFSYAVSENDISDVIFNERLDEILETEALSNVEQILATLEEKVDFTYLIYKFISSKRLQEWPLAKKIAKTLVYSNGLSKEDDNTLMISDYQQCVSLAYKCIELQEDKSEQYNFAQQLLQAPNYFQFVHKLNIEFIKAKTFSDEQQKKLNNVILRRALAETQSTFLGEQFPIWAYWFFHYWIEINHAEAEKYVKDFLEKDIQNVILLIKSFVSWTGHVSFDKSGFEGPYLTDLKEERYKTLTRLCDKEFLLEKITAFKPIEELREMEVEWIYQKTSKTFEEMRMLRQFLYWYDKSS